jgi:hypothetical protein
MNFLPLQVGKTYVTRKGEVHTVKHMAPNSIAVTTDDRHLWYANTGRCHFDGRDDEDDVVAEFVPFKPETPVIPHKDLIRAVLDGKTVQLKYGEGWADLSWEGLMRHLLDDFRRQHQTFRIKPEPVVRWTTVHRTSQDGVIFACWGHSSDRDFAAKHVTSCLSQNLPAKVLRLEFDSDTLDVISAKTEAP